MNRAKFVVPVVALALALAGGSRFAWPASASGIGGNINYSLNGPTNSVPPGAILDVTVALTAPPVDPWSGFQVALVYDPTMLTALSADEDIWARAVFGNQLLCVKELFDPLGGFLPPPWRAATVACASFGGPPVPGVAGPLAAFRFSTTGALGATAIHMLQPVEPFPLGFATGTLNAGDFTLQTSTYSCSGPSGACVAGINGWPTPSLLVNVVAQAQFPVSGHVYAGAIGAGFAAVPVQICEGSGLYCYLPLTTAADGSYRGEAGSGSFTITATPPYPYLPGSLSIVVSGPTAGQDIVLAAPTGAIGGHVYQGSSGNPQAGVYLVACQEGGGPCSPGVSTDGDGAYLISSLDDGTYRLYAYPTPPYAPTSGSGIAVVGGGTTTYDVTLPLLPTGGISGRVYHDTATPGNELAGVTVSACPNGSAGPCALATTDGSGSYTIAALADGIYAVAASPGNPYAGASITSVVTGGAVTPGQNIVVTAPIPIPPQASITNHGVNNGVPVVYWATDLTLTAAACASGTATYQIVAPNGTASGPMTETPPGSGNYVATVPALYPLHGSTLVTITVNCPGGGTQTVPFNIYIDPSGFVRDTARNPVEGATVSLLRAENPAGPFSQVANGSALMSPGNRRNPDTTDPSGHFGWDVAPGFYRVQTGKPGCVAPGDAYKSVVESGIMAIPPPVTDLDLRLDCTDSDADGYADSLELASGKDPATYCAIMRADVDADGSVTILDLSRVATRYLQTIPPAPARLDQFPPGPQRDNVLTILDLSAMAANYLKPVTQCP